MNFRRSLLLLILAVGAAAVLDAVEPPAIPSPQFVAVDRIRYFPAPKQEQSMLGGRFTGSNVSPREGFVPLVEIRAVPKAAAWSELTFTNTQPYRWVRYEGPAGSAGAVAELEFYAGAQKLKGTGFGTPGNRPPGGNWKAALDGKTETFFLSSNPDGQFVGIDLEEQASVARPACTPGGGDFSLPQEVKITSRTPGAVIRYTLDGTAPTAMHGEVYRAPLKLERNATITAVAFQEGVAPSPATFATIWVGAPVHAPMSSFHVGNSLTGNASRLPFFLRTAGGTDKFPAYLIGGATTRRLWDGREDDQKANWEKSWAAAQPPLDYFTLQPRDFDVAREADYCTRFLKLVREKSPNVQPWLYAEWVESNRARPTDKGEVPSSQMKKTFPALTWQESMGAMVLYNEEVQHKIAELDHEGKRVRIIPTALALGWARTLIDRGELPGIAPGQDSFYSLLFADSVHVNAAGCYLVDLTWYAALYRESPEGKMLPLGTDLTAEQAGVLQKLAWEVVRNYPDCGLYEEGKERCGAPTVIRNGQEYTLKSSTPGAWFRYTLDGTPPARTNGYIYTGAISIQPDTQLKVIAYESGFADSELVSPPAVSF